MDDKFLTVKCDPPADATEPAYTAAGRLAADKLWRDMPAARGHHDPGRLAWFMVPLSDQGHGDLKRHAIQSFSQRWEELAKTE